MGHQGDVGAGALGEDTATSRNLEEALSGQAVRTSFGDQKSDNEGRGGGKEWTPKRKGQLAAVETDPAAVETDPAAEGATRLERTTAPRERLKIPDSGGVFLRSQTCLQKF